ncbi:unnamed protein product [Rotaria sordida]|uniref:Uncharacterized protein n=1 Tax=Rotaria sordida TaxID=392033 RepID=A0A819YSH7_9BILA|nr:unnamed protein product [Rotaria sordida]
MLPQKSGKDRLLSIDELRFNRRINNKTLFDHEIIECCTIDRTNSINNVEKRKFSSAEYDYHLDYWFCSRVWNRSIRNSLSYIEQYNYIFMQKNLDVCLSNMKKINKNITWIIIPPSDSYNNLNKLILQMHLPILEILKFYDCASLYLYHLRVYELTSFTSVLPDNVLSLVDDAFCKMVEVVAGPAEAQLLEFQGVRGVYSFLNTDDVFGILALKCSTLTNIKKLICFEIDDGDVNTAIIKPGCRSNIRYLHQLLSQRHDEHMKQNKYKSSGNKQSQLTKNNDTSLNISQDLSQASSTSTTQQQSTGTSDVVNQMDHRDFILNALNEWCEKNLKLNNKTFIENEDFKLLLTQGASEGVCIICSCQVKFHLTRVRQHFSLKKKMINVNNDNRLNINSDHDSSDDEISDAAGSPQRKRLKT